MKQNLPYIITAFALSFSAHAQQNEPKQNDCAWQTKSIQGDTHSYTRQDAQSVYSLDSLFHENKLISVTEKSENVNAHTSFTRIAKRDDKNIDMFIISKMYITPQKTMKYKPVHIAEAYLNTLQHLGCETPGQPE